MLSTTQYLKLKQQLLEQEFSHLNDRQQQAVFQINGPLLILAGAGSGKTTVLINRIAFLLQYGNAYHSSVMPGLDEADCTFLKQYASSESKDHARLVSLLRTETVNPWNVLAITFTNKAANELKERLAARLGETGMAVRSGTFHSICVRILRREIEALGYSSSFTIYDTDDCVRVLKDCLKDLSVSDKMFPPKMVLGEISRQKDVMNDPEEAFLQAGDDFRLKTIANLYKLYQRRLKEANALDFDDLILLTVRLFRQEPDVLLHYQRLYRYVLVDEYQDTNQLQYQLVSLLSAGHGNLCVVGDDDQSIYKFRGATIENILSFEKQFRNAVVIRLEQNYRSTQNILDAANAVIANNKGRKGKTLWTGKGSGEKITVFSGQNDFAESQFVVDAIAEDIKNGMKASDHAILYRVNAQSNNLERALIGSGIAYQIFGGTKFFDRKEIKDVLAYFHLMSNPSDSVRLKRIINEPKRGIGAATIQKVETIALQTGYPMFEIMKHADSYESIRRSAKSLREFTGMIDTLSDLALSIPLPELVDEVLEQTGYRLALIAEGTEGEVRLENIEELKTNLVQFADQNPEGTLSDFLEEIALYTDLDAMNSEADKVSLMTIHSAKGLEFPVVFLVGLEEGLFPGYNSINGGESEIEEERRLAYVGITRAREHLFITYAKERMMYGSWSRNLPSRFVQELPEENIQRSGFDARQRPNSYSRPEPTTSFARSSVRTATPRREPVPNVGMSTPSPKSGRIFQIGERVHHKIFGDGTVLTVQPMGGDQLVEISFDEFGTKKIMAGFAKLTPCN